MSTNNERRPNILTDDHAAHSIGAYGSVVSAYELSCGDAASRLLFDIYQEENVETRAPAGFILAP